MCCFNKVNLSEILLVHKRIINKDCTFKNNNDGQLSCTTSFVTVLSGVDFGSHDSQTLRQITFLCGDFLKKQKWVPGVFPRGKGGRCLKLTTLPPSCAVVMKSGNLKFLEPSGPLQACDGTANCLFLKEGFYNKGLAQELWKILITFKRLLTALLTVTPFEKLQERRVERECMSTRKWGKFSTFALITYFWTYSWRFWRRYK